MIRRLVSVLWRLRRATAIESGLFKIQAAHLLQFRRQRQAHQERQRIIDRMYQNAVKGDGGPDANQLTGGRDTGSLSLTGAAGPAADLTCSFVRLC
ncbi:MAG: hypothetical protein ACREDL_17865, partial [Bradyrhizobium sp.]